MTGLFDPLRKLLADTCSPVKSAEKIKQLKYKLSKIKPEKLKKLADTEFLPPLLYYHLKTFNIPGYSHMLPQLKDSYMRNTARNVLLLKQLKALKKQAEQKGIKIILLKGAALAMSVYNEIGLRPMDDIDILVEQKHVDRIKELMEQNSMHPLFKDTNQNWLFNIKSHIVPYQTDDSILSLDVHTRLFDDRFIHFAELKPFENTFTINWDNESFLTLDPYTAFIYGLYHIAVHHNFSCKLRDIIDLSYAVSYYGLVPEKIFSYIDSTHAAGLFLPLIDTTFELSGVKPEHHNAATISHAYLYWTNSVVMKYLPIQASSRLSDPALRIATVLTSGVKKWMLHIFRFTDYEVSIFYKSQKGGILKKAFMGIWTIVIAIIYIVVLPLFYIKVKVQKIQTK